MVLFLMIMERRSWFLMRVVVDLARLVDRLALDLGFLDLDGLGCRLRLVLPGLLLGRGGNPVNVTCFFVGDFLGDVEEGFQGIMVDLGRTVLGLGCSMGGDPRHGRSKFGRNEANGECFIWADPP